MATLEQLESALVKADAAGNADDARAFAAEIRTMRGAGTEKRQSLDKGYLESLGAGLGKGVGTVALGAQDLVGMGLEKLGAEQAGKWLQSDAAMGRQKLAGEVAPYKEANPMTTGAGELGGEIAATLPVGGVLAKGVTKAASYTPSIASKVNPLAEALRTGGMSAGGMTGAGGLATRTAGGLAVGGTSAGLVNPEDAGVGATIGAALPVTGKLLGAAGQKVGETLRGGEVAPEVVALAQRAKDLGIDIPADRLTDSKFMNAIASGLNYVPLSGRAGTEQKMVDQLNTAASRLIGQDTKNMAQALRNAKTDLGGKFDSFLKDNTIKVDDALKARTAEVLQTAEKELSSDALKPIQNQIAEIFTKGASGEIDGQAAYNIKKTLDRIGKGQSSEAFHARELRDTLMDALERSVGPEKAAEFAKVRQQYGNMKSLQKIAQNGAEGEISVARLANMKNIGNQDLQELADISAQFVKPREGQHGSMQRGFAALGIGGLTGPAGLASAAGAGRVMNTALNSQAAKNFMLNQNGSPQAQALANALRQALPMTAPVIGAQ